jgi:hypothetical protein
MEHGGLAEPSATLRPTFEALANDYAAALGQVPTGSKDRIEELAHRFPGAAQLWEEFATMLPPAEREDALIRAARLKGIVGIEDRDDAVADASRWAEPCWCPRARRESADRPELHELLARLCAPNDVGAIRHEELR